LIPLFTGFYVSQLVEDFFHQQYQGISNLRLFELSRQIQVEQLPATQGAKRLTRKVSRGLPQKKHEKSQQEPSKGCRVPMN